MEIRVLRPSDDRSKFRSGDVDLDRFLRKFAGQNQFRHHIGTTYVACEGAALLGFVTVAPGQVEVEGLPASARRKLPHYPVPVLRLARLAVDERVTGRGLGTALIRFVLKLALRLSEDYGCAGVIVDAKPGAIAFYAKYGFFTLDPVTGQSDVRPEPTPLFLPVSTIRRAAPGSGD